MAIRKQCTTAHRLGAGIAACLLAAPVCAYELSDDNGERLLLDLEAGAGAFSSSEDYSGAGRDDVTWTESYAKLGVSGSRELTDGGTVYGAVSGVASATGGDGDAAGFTTGDESHVELEDLYLGWRSGSRLWGVQDAVDLAFGSRSFTLGDGWLIGGDALSFGEGLGDELDRGGAYWLAPRRAFRRTAIAGVDVPGPLRGDAFYLGSDNPAQGETELAGLSVEWMQSRLGTVGAYYLEVLDVDPDRLGGAFAYRDDLASYGLRGRGSLGVDNASFAFEATLQQGSPDVPGDDRDVDARAWYVEAGYQFVGLPLAPQLTYRFSSFSGDEPGSGDMEAFDPLFYGFTRGYGTWYQGEVAGNYTGPFNTNADVHHVGLYVHPTETIRAGALFFDFTTREPASGVSSDFGRELDVFVEVPVTENLFVSPVYSVFVPGDGGEQTLASDRTNHYAQVIGVLSF